MGKQRHNKKGPQEFAGLTGWERKYLEQSIKYGHLEGLDGKKKARVKSKKMIETAKVGC